MAGQVLSQYSTRPTHIPFQDIEAYTMAPRSVSDRPVVVNVYGGYWGRARHSANISEEVSANI